MAIRSSKKTDLLSASRERRGQRLSQSIERTDPPPSDHKRIRAESLLALESKILEQVASCSSLTDILVSLTRLIEEQSTPVLASVLLLDEDGIHLRHGAAPSLPEAYNRAVDGLEIGYGQGSCGTASFLRKQVIVKDIATDPLWEKYRFVVDAYGLRACWSTPIMATDGALLGTFAMYYRTQRVPTPLDLELIELATHLASIAIMRDRDLARLRKREQQLADTQRLAHLGGWEWDIRTNRLHWSDELYRIYGLSPQQFDATFEAYLLRVHPEDRALARRMVEGACQSGQPFSFEERIIRPDGTIRHLHSQGEVVLDEKGNPAKLTGFCQDITERKQAEAERERLFRQNEEARRRLQVLSFRLVDVQEVERHRIARELHDEIGQELTALKITLQMSLRMPPEQMKAALVNAQTRVGELLSQVREMSLDLRPAMLDDLGLLPALLWHFDRYKTQTDITVQFKHNGLEGRRFVSEMETAAYRIVQEALTNVARHAAVKEVAVRVWVDHETLTVEIEDEGDGFNPESALAAGASSGLSGMRERASLLGGELRIVSAPCKGTRLTATLPLGGPIHRRRNPL